MNKCIHANAIRNEECALVGLSAAESACPARRLRPPCGTSTALDHTSHCRISALVERQVAERGPAGLAQRGQRHHEPGSQLN